MTGVCFAGLLHERYTEGRRCYRLAARTKTRAATTTAIASIGTASTATASKSTRTTTAPTTASGHCLLYNVRQAVARCSPCTAAATHCLVSVLACRVPSEHQLVPTTLYATLSSTLYATLSSTLHVAHSSTLHVAYSSTPCSAQQHTLCSAQQHTPCSVQQHTPCSAQQHTPCSAQQHNTCNTYRHTAIAAAAAAAAGGEAAALTEHVSCKQVGHLLYSRGLDKPTHSTRAHRCTGSWCGTCSSCAAQLWVLAQLRVLA
ncbi:hypothetical protein FHG87_016736 [Trinorchestia longiramus]|nr:hypothetical protein FHG87_016736 [Trinorchestia longiramus]